MLLFLVLIKHTHTHTHAHAHAQTNKQTTEKQIVLVDGVVGLISCVLAVWFVCLFVCLVFLHVFSLFFYITPFIY